jgi:hypothetical protein
MNILTCANCGAKFDVAGKSPGTKLRCARCKNIVEVPAEAAPAPATGRRHAPPLPPTRRSPAPKAARDDDPSEADTQRSPAPRTGRTAAGKKTSGRGKDSEGSGRDRKKNNMLPVYAGIAAVVIIAIVVGVIVMKSGNKGPDGKKGGGGAGQGDWIAEFKKKNDMTKPENVFNLAMECKKRGAFNEYVEFIGQTVRMDPKHAGASGELKPIFKHRQSQIDVVPIVEGYLELAKWCHSVGLNDKFKDAAKRVESIEAIAGGEICTRQVAGLRGREIPSPVRQRGGPGGLDEEYARKKQGMIGASSETLDRHVELLKWTDAMKMEDEKVKEIDLLLLLDEDNQTANEMAGMVLFAGKWEPADWVKELTEANEANRKIIAELDAKYGKGKGQKIFPVLNRITTSPKLSSAKWTALYVEPYAVIIEDSKTYSEEIITEKFGELLQCLYKSFYGRYGKLLGMDDMNEVVPVIVCKDTASYHEKFDVPEWAGGHFSPLDRFLVVYHGGDDLYETVFHEGTHQLVFFARKGRMPSDLFWFTEGISTFHEAFKRTPDGKGFTLYHVSPDRLDAIKGMITSKKFEPLTSFMSLLYGQFWAESEDRGNPDAAAKGYRRYCEAWSLVYFLNTADNGKYREKWERYLKAEVEGKGGVKTVKEIFGDLAALEEEWKQYVIGLKAD